MERRTLDRLPSSLAVLVSDGETEWKGTCINLSAEGALLKLDRPWDGRWDIGVRFEAHGGPEPTEIRARIVRASSPDAQGAFLAVRFAG